MIGPGKVHLFQRVTIKSLWRSASDLLCLFECQAPPGAAQVATGKPLRDPSGLMDARRLHAGP